jgi:hypothetical protein
LKFILSKTNVNTAPNIPCASYVGQGTCNNTNAYSNFPVGDVFNYFNSYNSGTGNIGQQYINYDVNAVSPGNAGGALYGSLFPQQSCNNMWKSYISNKVNGTAGANGVLQISVNSGKVISRFVPDAFTNFTSSALNENLSSIRTIRSFFEIEDRFCLRINDRFDVISSPIPDFSVS